MWYRGTMKLSKDEARHFAAFRRSLAAPAVKAAITRALDQHRAENESKVSTEITAARVATDKAMLDLLFHAPLEGIK